MLSEIEPRVAPTALRRHIEIDATSQKLRLFFEDVLVNTYPVSTAKNGLGEQLGSLCTPRGMHVIRAKIGARQPENAVFVGRRPTGEIWTRDLHAAWPGRDWILSRVLWLCGIEQGRNRGGKVDTMRRHIYIHGCPDSVPVGIPLSHGCIRMRSKDVIELFDLIGVGDPVWIGNVAGPG